MTSDLAGQLDVGRIPPPPPPPPGDEKHGRAMRVLERAARVGPAITAPEVPVVQPGSIEQSR